MIIDLYHVKAHTGHPWNELADSVANIASNDRMPHAPREAAERLGPGNAYAWEWLKHAPDA
eukprot:12208681-Heterocapsa_arctica.AAC.1